MLFLPTKRIEFLHEIDKGVPASALLLFRRQQLAAEDRLERLRRKAALEHAVHGDGNAAGLLGHDHDHGIRMLAHTDARAVARAEIRAEVRVVRQRQDAAGRRDAAVPDHDRAVMQRSLGIENVLEQFRRHVRIDRGAAAHLLIERHAALKDNERTGLGRRQLRAGSDGLRNDIVHAQRLKRFCPEAR